KTTGTRPPPRTYPAPPLPYNTGSASLPPDRFGRTMATPTTDLLEIILRECAGTRPQPWYPYDYARDTGLPRDALDEPLDRLRLGGLVRLADWVQGKGQGYTLTPAGERVLARPRLLDRLREGVVPRAEPPAPRFQEEQVPGLERARAVRDALLDRSRPVATL